MSQETVKTKKALSDRDPNQTLQSAYNDVNATLAVDGFLTGKIGRRVDQVISTTSVSGDTSTYNFSENGTALYSIQLVYTDGTQGTLLYAARIS